MLTRDAIEREEWTYTELLAHDAAQRSRLAVLEAERDYLTLCLGEANASKEAAHGEVARLRAEVEALREALGEITKGDGVYYLTQEAAMAPGISGKWPDVIPAPHTPHGRLVKRALLAARKGEG